MDNEGDWHNNPWNSEQTYLKPGDRGTVTVIFGHQYGHKPGFALNPKEVVSILMFTGKAETAMSFRVESLVAGGPAGEKPPVDPASIRIQPKEGVMLGSGVKIDAKTQIEVKGTRAVMVARANGGQSLAVLFPAGKGEQSVAFKPPAGRWDLRYATEVRVQLKNVGHHAGDPQHPGDQQHRLDGHGRRRRSAGRGGREEIVASFIPTVPGQGVPVIRPGNFGNRPGTGTTFASDAVIAVKITAKHDGAAKLLVESVTAAASPAAVPDWLGKRPPVEGEWVQTLDENFDAPTIDQTKWNIYGPNYWDRASHWTKDNLILDHGLATLRFEKKRGFHNDNRDPKVDPQNLTGQKESDYACGYLDSLGKWTQRYGYFEARVKLPRARGYGRHSG